MKEQNKIPTGKIQRATKFVSTGGKVGGNYLKYYSKKILSGTDDREQLNLDNAEDIYNSLSELKGSALKVAQMLSMDKGILPQAYSEKFALSQYSAPPLSYPLVVNTFNRYFNASPQSLFDEFEKSSKHAASIGQVHIAHKDGKKLAVKIQYPGVADSIESDLRIIKPFVLRMFDLNSEELNHYLVEVKSRLLEETDYALEMNRSIEISEACAGLEGMRFPKYYPALSAERILTMDWIHGKHLDEFLATNPSQETKNLLGQRLWDFYEFQIHTLKQVHADPHPGNFLFSEDGTLGVIDFGCVKVIPEEFYQVYFQLLRPDVLENKAKFEEILAELSFILSKDNAQLRAYLYDVFHEMIELLARPFHTETFDFGSDAFFDQIYGLSNKYSKDKTLKNAGGARGPRDAIYLNRTYFGLYSILNKLKAKINTHSALLQPI
ncbi:MAG: AarF/ABC1/UbiB kinase family protein [Cryomorphaceae bacterium]|nr:AarF/ABC1/UbiB kinase family protein [Cryomorphaceae bacterium]